MHKHARRNSFLLALFFGTLAVLFGASAASAAGPAPDLEQLDTSSGYSYQSWYIHWDGGSGWRSYAPSATEVKAAYPYSIQEGSFNIYLFAGRTSQTQNVAGSSMVGSCNTNYVEATDDYSNIRCSAGMPADAEAGDYTLVIEYDPTDDGGTYVPASLSGMTFVSAGSSSGGSADPLNGQGFKLASESVDMFTHYVIPAVVLILIMAVAFRMIATRTTTILSGNGYTGPKRAYSYRDVHDPWNDSGEAKTR